MASTFDMDRFRTRLNVLMETRGVRRKTLAREAGLGETVIRDIMAPGRNGVGVSTLVRLADFFSVSLDDLAGQGGVPILGRVGAGGAIMFEEDAEPSFVLRPPVANGELLMALVVSGESMLPKYEDGDIIYVRRDHEGVLASYVGKYCAIGLEDGGVFLKKLALGSEPGRFTLQSLNAADMENEVVSWASPVLFVMPRSALEF